uniref:Uncharacterized protein n=1 Tax=Oryza rufipogon TaxID=4529 RepID=A0A0E0NC88_ORYRU
MMQLSTMEKLCVFSRVHRHRRRRHRRLHHGVSPAPPAGGGGAGLMSLSTPTTCCIEGLFSGEHSTISRSATVIVVFAAPLVPPSSSSSLSLASTMLRLFRFRITPRAQLTVESSHLTCPVTSSNTSTPKLYTSLSGVIVEEDVGWDQIAVHNWTSR